MSIFSDVLKLGVYEEQRKFWSTGSLSSETSEFYKHACFGPQRTIGDSKSRTSENTKYIYSIVSYKGSNKTHWRSEANVITSGFYQLWARQFIQLSHFWSCSLLSRIEALKERIVAWTSVHRNGKIRNDTRLASGILCVANMHVWENKSF